MLERDLDLIPELSHQFLDKHIWAFIQRVHFIFCTYKFFDSEVWVFDFSASFLIPGRFGSLVLTHGVLVVGLGGESRSLRLRNVLGETLPRPVLLSQNLDLIRKIFPCFLLIIQRNGRFLIIIGLMIIIKVWQRNWFCELLDRRMTHIEVLRLIWNLVVQIRLAILCALLAVVLTEIAHVDKSILKYYIRKLRQTNKSFFEINWKKLEKSQVY